MYLCGGTKILFACIVCNCVEEQKSYLRVEEQKSYLRVEEQKSYLRALYVCICVEEQKTFLSVVMSCKLFIDLMWKTLVINSSLGYI